MEYARLYTITFALVSQTLRNIYPDSVVLQHLMKYDIFAASIDTPWKGAGNRLRCV